MPTGEIVQYNVEVIPEALKNMRNRLFLELISKYRQSEFGSLNVAYDGMSNIYSIGTLPKDQYSLKVSVPGRRNGEFKDYQFKLRRVSSVNMEKLKKFLKGQLDYTPYDAITALEVIMKHPLSLGNILVNRSIFKGKNIEPISGGVDIWRGFFYSLRPSFGRLLLNVDISSTAFFGAGNCLDISKDFLGLKTDEPFPPNLDDRKRRNLESFFRSVRVQVIHRESKRRYKVLGLSSKGADQIKFTNDDGQELSVITYFRNKYGLALQNPKAPCLMTETSQKSIALPLECCIIPAGQKYTHKLSNIQTADMIKIANRKPNERMELIKEGYNLLEENKEFLTSFGFSIGSKLIPLQGRVLAPPTIYYCDKKSGGGRSGSGGAGASGSSSIKPLGGVWNLRNVQFESAAVIDSWAVLCMDRFNLDDVKSFINELCISCREVGIDFQTTRPPLVLCNKSIPEAIREACEKAQEYNNKPPQFILIILSNDDSFTYGEIKRVFDTIEGIPSQCMLSKHIRRPNKQYCANLALKINLKLGGINSSLDRQLTFIVEKPTIVFGADVTHPGIGEDDKPSIAAVVASLDIKMSRYASAVHVQPSRKEIIENLQQMAYNHLVEFERVNGKGLRPQRILFYRDGVSEGQFAHVLQYEIPALKAACKQIDPNYNPPVTYVLVHKRHHTRFFVTNSSDCDKSGNIPAGTVVDTDVVHPNQFDYYLCSHAGIQGTSRPTHYHVVFDENKFKSDDLQQLSYHLCYTFARCTRSVGIVPPAYYAHLAAFRARFHFKPNLPQSVDTFTPVKKDLSSQMYFM